MCCNDDDDDDDNNNDDAPTFCRIMNPRQLWSLFQELG